MAEKLHATPLFGFPLYIIGVGGIRDDHGNSIKGLRLNCATGERVWLPAALGDDFVRRLAMSVIHDRSVDGDLTLVDNLPSPLKGYCAAAGNTRPRSTRSDGIYEPR